MHFSSLEVLALTGFALLLGHWIHTFIPWTHKYSLPGPVLGGLVLCIVVVVLKLNQVPVQFDLALQTPLMVLFFSSLGFAASFKVLKGAGIRVIQFFILSVLLLFIQNLFGIGVAKILGESPLFGVMTSSVSLVGGPGTSLAFAELFESSGLKNAAEVGLTTAMAGIVLAGLIGGPVGTLLIQKFELRSTAGKPESKDQSAHVAISHSWEELSGALLKHLVVISFAMAIGGLVSKGLVELGFKLPIYIGGMIVAAFIRNVDDQYSLLHLDERFIELLGAIALALFIAMTMMTLDLSKIGHVAGSIAIAVVIQAMVVVVVSVGLIFLWREKNYEGAVLASGMIGFMLGTTANAMANLDSLTRKYGPAPLAYLAIPLVGACFIDFANAAVIAFLVNVFGT